MELVRVETDMRIVFCFCDLE